MNSANTFSASRLKQFSQTSRLEQLIQLSKGVVWDGDLLSKYLRDELVGLGLAERINGWNLITAKGVQFLINSGILHP